ncbi:MAG: hypothetical protein IJ325_02665 [Clostridia bacterium]|nr:hypothetical protein [Clostridia bacterium]
MKYNIPYYLSPFLLTPAVMLACSLMAELPGITPYMFPILCILCCLYAAVLAGFTRSPHSHDFLLTLLVPLSAFVTMFIVGFLDQTETRSRFDVEHAVDTAVQLPGWILYFGMAAAAFSASHKKLRIRKRR